MRIPLPVFYVAEGKDGRIIVVDGLQRLSTFRRYLDNDFKLTFSKSEDLEMPSNPLAGKSFDELQLKLRERLEDTQLTLLHFGRECSREGKTRHLRKSQQWRASDSSTDEELPIQRPRHSLAT